MKQNEKKFVQEYVKKGFHNIPLKKDHTYSWIEVKKKFEDQPKKRKKILREAMHRKVNTKLQARKILDEYLGKEGKKKIVALGRSVKII